MKNNPIFRPRNFRSIYALVILAFGAIPFHSFGQKITLTSTSFSHLTTLSDSVPNGIDESADLDGDGLPEIVTHTGTFLSVFSNRSTADSISFVNALNLTDTYGISSVGIGDIDGDGKPDLVLSSAIYRYTKIGAFLNTSTPGSLSFSPYILIDSEYTVAKYIGVLIKEIDGDGKPDIFGIRTDSSGVPFLNSSSPGNLSFTYGPGYPAYTTYFTKTAISEDFNGDGLNDLVSISNGGYAAVTMNKSAPGNPHFVYLGATDPYLPNQVYSAIASGDLNGDGKPDLAITSKNQDTLRVYINTSAADSISFTPAIFYATGYQPVSVSIGDIDNDGKPDILVGNQGSSTTSVFLNSSSPGNFAITPAPAIGQGWLSGTPALADFNGDGVADLSVVVDSTHFGILENKITPTEFPKIVSFFPMSGSTDSIITIKGSHLSGLSGVRFGNASAASFTIYSDSLVRATVGGGASGYVYIESANGLDSLSGFTYHAATPVKLPLEFTRLSAERSGSQAMIRWQVKNDSAATGYVVEKSVDSLNFFVLDSVTASKPAGGSYTFTDPLPGNKVVYYFVRAKKADGTETASAVIWIDATIITNAVKSYPNPVSGKATVEHPASENAAVIKVYDMNGQEITRVPVSPHSAQTSFVLPPSLNGVYKLTWSDGKNSKTQTIVVRP